MPTSATGNPEPSGFTLVELMVVLAIVGLMTAFTVLNLPSSSDDLVREGERFAARLIAARDNAIVANRETAAIVDAQGYRFEERAGKGWRPLGDKPLVATAWNPGTQAGEARIGFDSVGLAEPQTIVLANGDSRAAISVTAAGEVRVNAR